jgi:hypothetical protein
MIKIRHALCSDIKDIKLFIKKYWGENHVLVKSNKIFNHLYINKRYNTLQFFIGLDNSQKIQGVIGYIKNSQYDSTVTVNGVWLALWKVKPNLNQPLGMQLLNTLENDLKADFIACFGINKLTVPIYKKLGYISGPAQQFFFQLT